MRTSPGVAVLLLGFGLAAQEQPPARPARTAAALAEALASKDANKIAWAAYEARKLGDKSLQGPLQQALRSLASSPADLAPHARLFVLDALASARVKVPPTDLLPLLDDEVCGTVAFLLLAREPRQNAAELFERFKSDWPKVNGRTWTLTLGRAEQELRRTIAIGNLLQAQAASGFAAFLLASLDLDLHVQVVTPNDGMAFDDTWSIQLPETQQPPAGLPPLPLYELVRMTGNQPAGTEPLAPGALPIDCLRTEPSREGRSIPLNMDAPQLDGLIWLLPLAKLQEAPPRQHRLAFADVQTYTADVTKARTALVEFRAALVAGLVAQKALLATAAKEVAIPIAVHVLDQRLDTKAPLPEIPAAK